MVGASASGPANLAEASFSHDARSFTFGDFPRALFDGDPTTVGLANYVDEPVGITLIFPKPINVNGAGGVFHSEGVWTLEAAANLTDLENRSGSYRKLVDRQAHVTDGWSRRSFTAGTFTVFRFTDHRTVGDGFVHINDWS